MAKKTIEQKVGETVLQQPRQITAGGRTFTVAPPSVATLILASEAVSQLPQVKLDRKRIVEETLFAARFSRPLGDVAAILILGAKGLTEAVKTRHRRFFGLWHTTKTETIDRKAELSKWLLENLDSAGLNKLIFELLKDFQLGDFFGTITFLIEVNLLRPTKVIDSETTASGQ